MEPPHDPPAEHLDQDLGLGGRLSERSRSRLLNRDGTFNVRRNDFGPLHPFNAYNTLLSLPVGRLLALVGVCYIGVNLLFATLYWMLGPEALVGDADTASGRFEDAFFFSVQTLATIGYGRLIPSTRTANLLVAFEALVGLLGFAILSALLFARFTRPTARIAFSTHALVAPYRDGWALMFRLANLRNHNFTDVRAVVTLARWLERPGGRRRQFTQLTLERDAIIFMPLHWVIVHPVGEDSPLHGISLEELTASEPEVVCLITGHDETFAQTVYAKTSFAKTDIVWGARFRDMYVVDSDRVAIDMNKLHDFERLPAPDRL